MNYKVIMMDFKHIFMKHVLFFFVIISLSGCFGNNPDKTGHEGKPLPAFSMLLADSVTWFNPANSPSGRAAVLLYFSPYCPHCRAQMDEIIEDMDRLREIQFYLVTSFPMRDMKLFYKKYKLGSYPNITVGMDTANFLSRYFEIPAVPYMAIYGKDRKLRKTFIGEVYSRQIKAVSEE